jgi:hypothetical protein
MINRFEFQVLGLGSAPGFEFGCRRHCPLGQRGGPRPDYHSRHLTGRLRVRRPKTLCWDWMDLVGWALLDYSWSWKAVEDFHTLGRFRLRPTSARQGRAVPMLPECAKLPGLSQSHSVIGEAIGERFLRRILTMEVVPTNTRENEWRRGPTMVIVLPLARHPAPAAGDYLCPRLRAGRGDIFPSSRALLQRDGGRQIARSEIPL